MPEKRECKCRGRKPGTLLPCNCNCKGCRDKGYCDVTITSGTRCKECKK